MNVHETFRKDRPREKEQLVKFWGDQLSHLCTEIKLFLLRLFACKCKTVLLYYCSLGVSTIIMSMIFVMSLISIFYTSLTL